MASSVDCNKCQLPVRPHHPRAPPLHDPFPYGLARKRVLARPVHLARPLVVADLIAREIERPHVDEDPNSAL